MGYVPAGMRFNSVSTRHTSDTFHVCYEVMSINTAEPRCAMRDGDRRNTGKSVDRGSVTERSVAGAAERSGIRKNKGKIAISSQSPVMEKPCTTVYREDLPLENLAKNLIMTSIRSRITTTTRKDCPDSSVRTISHYRIVKHRLSPTHCNYKTTRPLALFLVQRTTMASGCNVCFYCSTLIP